MKAVILSAGQGKRLLPLTEDTPKCLIRLAGRSLLEWQVRALGAGGVEEAVVVTGFEADKVDAEVARLGGLGVRLRTLHNPFHALADNLASCWAARHELVGGVMILNGDTLLQPAIVRRLSEAPPAAITVTIDRKPAYDLDDMKVQTAEGRLLAIGKTLEAATVDGESIGFLRFDAEGAAMFVEAADRLLRTPAGLRVWYLSVIDTLAKATGKVAVASIEGLAWGEMDFPADVAVNEALARGWLAAE